MLGINPLNLDSTTGNIMTKMMVFDTYMTSSGTKTRGVGKLNAALIIFKNS